MFLQRRTIRKDPTRGIQTMKIPFLFSLFAVFAIRAGATSPIPPELVGEWRCGRYVFLFLRADGAAELVGGPPPIGVAALAIYDPKTSTVLLSERPSPSDRPAGVKALPDTQMVYNAKAKTITDPTDKLVFHRLGKELPDDVKELDIKKLRKTVR